MVVSDIRRYDLPFVNHLDTNGYVFTRIWALAAIPSQDKVASFIWASIGRQAKWFSACNLLAHALLSLRLNFAYDRNRLSVAYESLELV
jgi:hypothetical protein